MVGRKWRGQFAGKPIKNAAANQIKRTAYLLSIFCQVGGATHLAPDRFLKSLEMVKKKLDQYRGKLSPAQISEGMNAAISNAKRLAGDAELLLKERRFPSAASLAVLSIEESGKLSILRQLAVVQNDKKLIDSWKQYRSHTKKNVAWILPYLVKGGSRKLDDLKPIFDESSCPSGKPACNEF